MIQADSVHSTPPTNTSSNNPLGLARQQRERERALRRVAKLRRKASDEIDRLLAFLDASDPYVSTELEQEDGDDEPEGEGRGRPHVGSRLGEVVRRRYYSTVFPYGSTNAGYAQARGRRARDGAWPGA